MHPLALLLWLAADGPAETKPEVEHRLPALAAVFPQGAGAGAQLRIEVLGQHLDRASQVLFLDSPIRASLAKVEPTRLEIDVVVPAGARVGPHYFRIVSPRGASNTALFRVGSHRHQTETEPNSTLETAEAVKTPVTINGRLNADDDYDFYRFHAKAGETLIFDVRGARNGSGLDAALILLDSSGRKLEHDEDTFIWDPFFVHRFEAEGDYTAVIQPTSTRNDPGFAYQLDIRHAPHFDSMSPVGLRPGMETEVTLFGQGLLNSGARLVFGTPGFSGQLVQARGESATARIAVPAGADAGPHELFVEQAGEGLSNPVSFLVEPAPVYSGNGPIVPPMTINGTARYRKPDRFSFHAEAGQTLVFEVRAQRFGSPSDLLLRVLDGGGKAIANNDDGTFAGAVFNKDARMVHKFKDAGDYTLEVRNLVQVSGENAPYQILVAPPRPTVDVMFATDNPYVYPGEPRKLKLTAQRNDGHSDSVPLQAAGLPAGVTASPAAIKPEEKEVEMELTAAAGTAPGTWGALAVTGGAAPAWRAVQVASGGGEGRHYGRVTGATLAVVEKPLFSIECAATSLNLVRGGTVDLKVMIRRREGFQEKLEFLAYNLPPEVSMETVESGVEWATVRFRAAKTAQLGRAARVVAAASGGGQTHQAPKISIVVD